MQRTHIWLLLVVVTYVSGCSILTAKLTGISQSKADIKYQIAETPKESDPTEKDYHPALRPATIVQGHSTRIAGVLKNSTARLNRASKNATVRYDVLGGELIVEQPESFKKGNNESSLLASSSSVAAPQFVLPITSGLFDWMIERARATNTKAISQQATTREAKRQSFETVRTPLVFVFLALVLCGLGRPLSKHQSNNKLGDRLPEESTATESIPIAPPNTAISPNQTNQLRDAKPSEASAVTSLIAIATINQTVFNTKPRQKASTELIVAKIVTVNVPLPVIEQQLEDEFHVQNTEDIAEILAGTLQSSFDDTAEVNQTNRQSSVCGNAVQKTQLFVFRSKNEMVLRTVDLRSMNESTKSLHLACTKSHAGQPSLTHYISKECPRYSLGPASQDNRLAIESPRHNIIVSRQDSLGDSSALLARIKRESRAILPGLGQIPDGVFVFRRQHSDQSQSEFIVIVRTHTIENTSRSAVMAILNG